MSWLLLLAARRSALVPVALVLVALALDVRLRVLYVCWRRRQSLLLRSGQEACALCGWRRRVERGRQGGFGTWMPWLGLHNWCCNFGYRSGFEQDIVVRVEQ